MQIGASFPAVCGSPHFGQAFAATGIVVAMIEG
jgi:hypothetical protein